MPQNYRKPMYARGLGLAARINDQTVSFMEAVLDSAVVWWVAGLETAKRLLNKNKRNKIED